MGQSEEDYVREIIDRNAPAGAQKDLSWSHEDQRIYSAADGKRDKDDLKLKREDMIWAGSTEGIVL